MKLIFSTLCTIVNQMVLLSRAGFYLIVLMNRMTGELENFRYVRI